MVMNVIFTAAAIAITVTTATISMLSSGLIIYIIFQSVEKLNTTYHRIMCSMSFFDILYSLAIALTTLPMPSNVKEVYPFIGLTLGTATTCEIQGLVQVVSTTLVSYWGVILSLYFLLKIGLHVSDKHIARIFEPIIYIFGFSAACYFVGYPFYKTQLLNPVPYVPWCAPGDYPLGCNRFGIPCIRGMKFRRAFGVVFQYFYYFVIHCICMLIVILRVKREESKLRSLIRLQISTPDGDQSILAETRMNELKLTKVVIKQAVLYVGAFVLTYTITPNLTNFPKLRYNSIRILVLVLKPLQGFWTMLVFVIDKIYILRRAHPNDEELKKFRVAFLRLIRHPSSLPGMHMSQMSVVRHHDDQYEMEVEREREREHEFGNVADRQDSIEVEGSDDGDDCESPPVGSRADNDDSGDMNFAYMAGNRSASAEVIDLSQDQSEYLKSNRRNSKAATVKTTNGNHSQDEVFSDDDLSKISKVDMFSIGDLSFPMSSVGEGGLGDVSSAGISCSLKSSENGGVRDKDDTSLEQGGRNTTDEYEDSRKFALELSKDLSSKK